MPMSEHEPDGNKVAASPQFREFCGKLIKWLVLCECYPYRMSLLVLKIFYFEQKHETNLLVEKAPTKALALLVQNQVQGGHGCLEVGM